MTQQPEAPPHPVADFALRGRARLDHLHSPAARPVWAMTTAELRTSALELATMAHQLEALHLSVLAECERRGEVADPSDRTAADWLARHTGTRPATARADLALALALEAHHPVLREAFATGRLSGEQVRTIKHALDLLPEQGEFAVDAAQRTRAEATLVELAAHHDTKALKILGAKIYAVVCPEHAEAYEGRRLEAAEARAARKVTLETWTDHQGITHGRFRIPALHGQILKKALDAIMSPTRTTSLAEDTGQRDTGQRDTSSRDTSSRNTSSRNTSSRDTRPLPVRRGEAFCDLLERLHARDLPTTGGGDATIVVTLTHEQLTHALSQAGVATLDTGTRISAAEARRLACTHRLLPVVLDGESIPLDLGRSQRLHTKHQRLAMGLRDRGCTVEGCDVPAAWCHAHHDNPWSAGGHTDLQTGRLLCGPHHRRIHDPAYRHTTTSDNKIVFHRRE